MAAPSKKDERPIIVKKIKKAGGGHHGGAWKVAYADFVTAMMAFFLLMWLLNVTTKDQKLGLADYFNPTPKIAKSDSGAGGMLGGLSMSPDGAMVTTVQKVAPTDVPPALRAGSEPPKEEADPDKISDERLKEEIRKREEENFKKAEAAINKEMDADPALQELKKSLLMDMTPEGLRIQVIDQEGKPMFASGSAQMYERTRTLLEKVSQIIKKLPNEISIRGHTDSVPYSKGADYTNFELSADRANSSRRVMIAAGFPEERINNVLGKADRDHLLPDKPQDQKNRRISIILLRDDVVTQIGANMSTKAVKEKERAKKDPLYRRSSGSIDFP